MTFDGIFDAREGDCAPFVAPNAQGSVLIGSPPGIELLGEEGVGDISALPSTAPPGQYPIVSAAAQPLPTGSNSPSITTSFLSCHNMCCINI